MASIRCHLPNKGCCKQARSSKQRTSLRYRYRFVNSPARCHPGDDAVAVLIQYRTSIVILVANANDHRNGPVIVGFSTALGLTLHFRRRKRQTRRLMESRRLPVSPHRECNSRIFFAWPSPSCHERFEQGDVLGLDRIELSAQSGGIFPCRTGFLPGFLALTFCR